MSEPGPGDTQPEDRPTAEGFDALFTAVVGSPTLRRIWREAFGAEYPDGCDPFSFVTLTDLRRISRALQVGPGQTFVDIACGGGGSGLWVARETGASLVGVDFSSVATTQAAQRALNLGLGDRAQFLVADAASTGLAAASLDAAMSVDALQLTPDRAAVLAEVARILRPRASCAFTTWDSLQPPAWRPSMLRDHRPPLQAAGFVVDAYDETPNWRQYQQRVYDGILANQAALFAELGDAVAQGLTEEATRVPTQWVGSEQSQRILVVAHKA